MVDNTEIIEKTRVLKCLTDKDLEMLKKNGKRLGSTLCMVLRHHPERIGIAMDKQAWVDVDELIQKLQSDGLDALHLQKDQPIYLLCYTGENSDEYAKYFCSSGYEAYSIVEGYRGYLRWSFVGRKHAKIKSCEKK